MENIKNTSENKPLILAVDDDQTLRMHLVNMLENLDYSVIEAQNGKQALEIIIERQNEIDAIILDREMPVMDGITLMTCMKDKKELRNIPIIMQTSSDKPEQIREGIDTGIFYYLTKPINQDILKSVLSAAILKTNQQRLLSLELKKHKLSFNLMEKSFFRFKTLNEAESLATFLANCFPDAERTIMGLSELFINAVEHGNLEIGFYEKSKMVADGTWRGEIERRLLQPEYMDKEVFATYERKEDGFYITVLDQGKGFNWRHYLNIDPSRANDNHGCGVAQANAISFDKLIYNDIGNEVTGYVSNEPKLDW